jgi:AraC family transcriptional regulator
MDRFAFAHAFARTVGISPHQALIRRRLSVAEERLIASDDTVLAVALDSGFGSLSSFNRAFRRAYGVTPRVFRLRAR